MFVIVVATTAPWYTTHTVDDSTTLTGWDAWRTIGDLNASLRPLPLALLVYLTACFIIYGALRNRFGTALICAIGIVAAGILPSMLMAGVNRRLPGSDWCDRRARGGAATGGRDRSRVYDRLLARLCPLGAARHAESQILSELSSISQQEPVASLTEGLLLASMPPPFIEHLPSVPLTEPPSTSGRTRPASPVRRRRRSRRCRQAGPRGRHRRRDRRIESSSMPSSGASPTPR